MRVCLVLSSLENGGAERQMVLLASNMSPQWDMTVIGLSDGVFANVLRDLGVRLLLFPRRSRFGVGFLGRLWTALAREKPDVVHSHGWIATLACLPVCRLLGIPLVDASIRHGSLMSRRGRLTAYVARCATHAIANSRAGLESHGVPEARGTVVYNGLDMSRLLGQPRGLPDEPIRVIMAARMSHEKDWDTLIAVAEGLVRESPSAWRFVLVGGGPDRDRVLRRAASLIETGSVEIPEPRLDVMPLIQGCHIGVLLSNQHHGEGCSNSILEYMAAGLPVICSDSGGNREVVTDGWDGYVVQTWDSAAIAERLRLLQSSRETRVRLGKRAALAVQERFTIPRMVTDTVAVYNSVVSPRGKKRC